MKPKTTDEVMEQVVHEQTHPPNGNGKDVETKLQAIRDSGIMAKFEQQMNERMEEKTKFTVLHDLSNTDPDKIKMHTHLTEKEIYAINKLYMVGMRMTHVFGDSAYVNSVRETLNEHVREHRLNKMAVNRGREYSLVHAVRGDNTVTQTESAIQKVFKYK